jgi:uncharacterized protein YicC (UPF0701 family)
MDDISYYLEQAMRARRLAAEINRQDIRESLTRLAAHHREVAEDIANGVPVRHPEPLHRG